MNICCSFMFGATTHLCNYHILVRLGKGINMHGGDILVYVRVGIGGGRLMGNPWGHSNLFYFYRPRCSGDNTLGSVHPLVTIQCGPQQHIQT